MIGKLKSRLCASGFRQIFGMDFTETHAPVTVLSAWRANVAEMSKQGWMFDIWDVKGAYLTSELIEDIYVQPPEGLEIPSGCEGKVLKLLKALYGLKQAGRAWNQKFSKLLVENGFRISVADPSLFMKERTIDGKKEVIRMNVHVDDAFAVYSHQGWYDEFKA